MVLTSQSDRQPGMPLLFNYSVACRHPYVCYLARLFQTQQACIIFEKSSTIVEIIRISNLHSCDVLPTVTSDWARKCVRDTAVARPCVHRSPGSCPPGLGGSRGKGPRGAARGTAAATDRSACSCVRNTSESKNCCRGTLPPSCQRSGLLPDQERRKPDESILEDILHDSSGVRRADDGLHSRRYCRVHPLFKWQYGPRCSLVARRLVRRTVHHQRSNAVCEDYRATIESGLMVRHQPGAHSISNARRPRPDVYGHPWRRLRASLHRSCAEPEAPRITSTALAASSISLIPLRACRSGGVVRFPLERDMRRSANLSK